ncbi:uncharacterized protein PADG_01693 [Paracoccidioides brasiliensis Pb18]|uniref:Uncharacterized protein n=1 Tax=Paracoccidioides brasiliensis (strain Pb18) TaxID=502780 RepID=C1G427_PARBD|nr:uncharacterized protein PADG_01693 [Paracoccidioides brasiliensis Pb18]EEH45543.2 hypothetical protein PADG_01693 [Paracoccidioides brasiliensis Pb18]
MELFGATSIGKYGAEGSLATFREYPDDQAPWTCWKEGKIRTGRVTLKELARSTGVHCAGALCILLSISRQGPKRCKRDVDLGCATNHGSNAFLQQGSRICQADGPEMVNLIGPHPGFQSSIAKRPRDGVGDKKQWKEELIIECH